MTDLRSSIAALSPEQRRALEERLRPKSPIRHNRIERRSGDADPQLSFGQERLWRLDRLMPNQSGYLISRSHRLVGPLEVEAVRAAVDLIVRRHEQLRARFSPIDRTPVIDLQSSRFEFVDLTHTHDAMAFVAKAAEAPLDTAEGPLFRAVLWKLGEADHILTLIAHHLVCDGWSLALVERQIGEALAGNLEIDPEELTYFDFVEWEKGRTEELRSRLAHWRIALTGVTRLQLPGEGATGNGNLSFDLPTETSNKIDELARTERMTPFIILMALFVLALQKQTGQTDLVISTPVAGRDDPDLEGIVGYFNNLVALRARLDGTGSFRQLLHRLRPPVLEAFEHQTPFQWVAEMPEAKLTPLARAMFALNDIPNSQLTIPEVDVTHIVVGGTAADFELGWFMRTVDGAYRTSVRFRGLERAAVEQLTNDFLTLAHAYTADPDLPIELPNPVEPATMRLKDVAVPNPRTLVESQVKSQWEAVFGREIGVDDDFFELGGHSLLAADLMERLETEIVGHRLPLAALLAAPTVAQLSAMIEQEGWSKSWSSLVPMKPTGNRVPFFFVHAHGGNVLGYRDLAKRMHPDQPFYGLQTANMDNPDSTTQRFEEMAAHYVAEIQTVQPHGPYVLGGYCLGGGVAYEMAQQLQGSGEEVAVVVMVDNPRPQPAGDTAGNGKNKKVRRRTKREWSNFAEKERKFRYIRKRIGQVQRRIFLELEVRLTGGDDSLPLGMGHSSAYRERRIAASHLKAYEKYEPQPYGGRVAIIRAAMEREGGDPALGWRDYINGPLDLYEAPGHQTGLLLEPRVRTVAPIVEEAIAAAFERQL